MGGVYVGGYGSVSGEMDLYGAPSLRNQEAGRSRWCPLQLFDEEA